jgi:branched-chain amino acid transport system substrate-binding protein
MITLGAAGPWKAGYGRMNKLGIDLAVEEMNAHGGVAGHKIEVIERDDDGKGSKAAEIAAEFVDNHTILGVIGHVNSGAMVAAAKVYDGRLTALATTASSPDLTGISPWVFRVISSDSTNGRDIARFAARLGRRRAAVLYENDSYGRGLTESFRRNFAGTIVTVDPIDAAGSGIEPFISFLKREKPDVVFVAGTEVSGIALLREARRQRLDVPFIGGDGWAGVVADTVVAEGAYVGAPFSAEDPRPEARRFVEAFQRKYGRAPDGNAALAYDATMLMARAASQAHGSREAVRDYLTTLVNFMPYAGVTGAIAFLPSGDPAGRGIVMTRVHNGAMLVENSR